jgi:SAM-dependent methyltransferase
MQTKTTIPDRSRDMDEKSWWDFWNMSYRTEIENDAVPSELFARVATIVNEITRTEGGRVLEIACGTGLLSRLLVYSSYQGLDMSPAAIEIARQMDERILRPAGTSCPTYEVADFHERALPAEPFDVAVCVDAFVWFRDQRLALSKMAQSLRTGGKLVLIVINPFVYRRIRRTQESPLREGPVSNWLSRRELHALIKSAGFSIEDSCTIMPRGNLGVLRLINARRLNQAFGPRSAATLKRLKEQMGFGQYCVVVARNGVQV